MYGFRILCAQICLCCACGSAAEKTIPPGHVVRMRSGGAAIGGVPGFSREDGIKGVWGIFSPPNS